MLVLSRRKKETIIIGDTIKITVADIKNDCVRIAIDAPNDVKIFREEIYQSVAEENQAASIQLAEQELEALGKMTKK